MEIMLSVNRSWIDDAYFSLYRPIHPGKNSGGGEMSGGNCPNTMLRFLRLHIEFPSSVWEHIGLYMHDHSVYKHNEHSIWFAFGSIYHLKTLEKPRKYQP